MSFAGLPKGALPCIDFMDFDSDSSASIVLLDIMETFKQFHFRSSSRYPLIHPFTTHQLNSLLAVDNIITTACLTQSSRKTVVECSNMYSSNSLYMHETHLPPSTCPVRLKNALWRRWWKQHQQITPKTALGKVALRRSKHIQYTLRLPKESPMDPCYKPLLCPIFVSPWDNAKYHNLCSSASCPEFSTPSTASLSEPSSSEMSMKPKSILKKPSSTFAIHDLVQFAKSLKERGCTFEQRKAMLLSAWEVDRPNSVSLHYSSSSPRIPHNTLKSHQPMAPYWNCSSGGTSASSSPSLTHSASFSSDNESDEDSPIFNEEATKLDFEVDFHPDSLVREHPAMVCFHWKVEQCIIVKPIDRLSLNEDAEFDSAYQTFYSSVSHYRSNISSETHRTQTQFIKPISPTVLKPDISVSGEQLPLQGPHIVKVKPDSRYRTIHATYPSLSSSCMHSDDDSESEYEFQTRFDDWLSQEGIIQNSIDLMKDMSMDLVAHGHDVYRNASEILALTKAVVRNWIFF